MSSPSLEPEMQRAAGEAGLRSGTPAPPTGDGGPLDVRPVRSKRDMPRAETGWILEVNEPMNRAMEALAGRIIKRYRIYERRLEPDRAPAFPGSSHR